MCEGGSPGNGGERGRGGRQGDRADGGGECHNLPPGQVHSLLTSAVLSVAPVSWPWGDLILLLVCVFPKQLGAVC